MQKFTVSKGKPKSKPDGSASKLTSDRVRSSGNSTARIPFTIFEDEPQPKKSAAKKSINKPATVAVTPILTGKEHKTRGSSVGGAVQTSVEKKGSLKTPGQFYVYYLCSMHLKLILCDGLSIYRVFLN